MGGRKFFVTGLAVFSFLLISVSSYAATIQQTVEGRLYLATPPGNSYGLNTGAIFWTVAYDDTQTGFQEVTFFDFLLPNNTHYYLADFPSIGVPTIYYDGIKITSLAFSSLTYDAIGLPTLISKDGSDLFTLDGVDGFYGEGVLNFTPIPIPGAVWLLGAGLTGLAVLRQRFRKE